MQRAMLTMKNCRTTSAIGFLGYALTWFPFFGFRTADVACVVELKYSAFAKPTSLVGPKPSITRRSEDLLSGSVR